MKIVRTIAGQTEDEEAVYGQVSRIKTKEEYTEFNKLFNAMNLTKSTFQGGMNYMKGYTYEVMVKLGKKRKREFDFPALLKKYFNSSEIDEVNGRLPQGVPEISTE